MERGSPTQKPAWVSAPTGDSAISVSGQGTLEHFKIKTQTANTAITLKLFKSDGVNQVEVFTLPVAPAPGTTTLLRLPSYTGSWIIQPLKNGQKFAGMTYDDAAKKADFPTSTDPQLTISMEDDSIGILDYTLWAVIIAILIAVISYFIGKKF